MILWYISKEVEDEVTHEIRQTFSFWSKLMVTGDTSPDVCQNPLQTSILSHNGEYARCLVCNPGSKPSILLSREGVTQGCPQSRILYGLGLLPLA
jgi:hypothetical protein